MNSQQEGDRAHAFPRRDLLRLGIGAVTFLGFGGVVAAAVSRKNMPVSTDTGVNTAPATRTSTAPARFEALPVNGYWIDGKKVPKDTDTEGIFKAAEHIIDLMFNSPNPVEDVFNEYARGAKEVYLENPKDPRQRGIQKEEIETIVRDVKACGAGIDSYRLVTKQRMPEGTYEEVRGMYVDLTQHCQIGRPGYPPQLGDFNFTFWNDGDSKNPNYHVAYIRY